MSRRVLIKRSLNLLLIIIVGVTITYAGIRNHTNTYSSRGTNSPTYKVVQVLDGDTAKLNINGQIRTVRFIGMDTPEVVDPRKVVQCFGREASSKGHQLLDNQSVGIEYDDSVGRQDKYGRLLGYIILPNGEIYNKKMIADGFAHEYTYQNQTYKYQAEFRQAQANAKQNNLGLWNINTCGGDTTKPAV